MVNTEPQRICSIKQDQEKGEGQNGSWPELPQDVLCLVSAHLFIWDLLAFRAICKSWQSITPINRPLLPLMDSPHSQSPCLISLNNHTCKFFHPIQNDTYQMHIPELQGASIRFSKYGWLLLSRKDCSIFFFHPFNRIKIEIPRYPKEDAFQTMCFSSPPDSIDCFVFGITFDGAKFGIIRRGEAYWTIHKFIWKESGSLKSSQLLSSLFSHPGSLLKLMSKLVTLATCSPYPIGYPHNFGPSSFLHSLQTLAFGLLLHLTYLILLDMPRARVIKLLVRQVFQSLWGHLHLLA